MSETPLNILVTDDEEMIRALLTEFLLLDGYAVATAADADEALMVLRRRKVDLLITDLMMPGVSGVELVEQVSRVYPNLPCIILSAFGTIERARESLQRGAVDFLTKPVTRNELSIAVERNLERRRLETQRLREITADILFQAIQALAACLEIKDPYTHGHSQRVAEIADRLAVAVGVSAEDRYVLRLAGAMHDIGKIGVRDTVLRKAGPLDDAEWDEMRAHPHVGSEAISHIKEMGQVATVIRHHHENVDGSGYPDGLEGDAIPFLARILAVADAYEAMISDRSYRKGMTRERAFDVLLSECGRRYERQLVDLLIRIEGGACGEGGGELVGAVAGQRQ